MRLVLSLPRRGPIPPPVCASGGGRRLRPPSEAGFAPGRNAVEDPPMGGLSLRRRLPHHRTWIGGGGPSQAMREGQSAPRMARSRATARTAAQEEPRRDAPPDGLTTPERLL